MAVADDPSSDNAGVRIVPPAVYLGGLAIGYILDLVRHIPIAPPGRSLGVRIVGIVVVAVGVSIMLSALALFRRLGTQVAPWEPTTKLAVDGPYRFTRNPMYLGMAFILAGLGLIGNTVWPILAMVPAIIIIRTQVIAREERYLERKFGDEYRAFKTRVRRWL
jgi:protein-S-isoprenylcysteine O-methyltransferase Ste14